MHLHFFLSLDPGHCLLSTPNQINSEGRPLQSLSEEAYQGEQTKERAGSSVVAGLGIEVSQFLREKTVKLLGTIDFTAPRLAMDNNAAGPVGHHIDVGDDAPAAGGAAVEH